MNETTGTFTKLDGEWLVRLPGLTEIETGAEITVTKRNGETKIVFAGALTRLTDEGALFVDFTDKRPAPAPVLGEFERKCRHCGEVWTFERFTETHGCAAEKAFEATPVPHRWKGNGRTTCLECGGALTDFDRKVSDAPGFHYDCA